MGPVGARPRFRLGIRDLDSLIASLEADGFEVVGPVVRGGAVVHEVVHGVDDLPRGWRSHQRPGRYQLEPRGDGRLFAYGVEAASWKSALLPARRPLLSLTRSKGRLRFVPSGPDPSKRRALLGVRACDLSGLERLGQAIGPKSVGRLEPFVIAVACTEPQSTCFCAAMGTGPMPRGAFDIALVELSDRTELDLLAEAGSEAGRARLESLGVARATEEQIAVAEVAIGRASESMGRNLDLPGLPAQLLERLDDPHWDRLEGRCLACGNCTMACPTCFCTDVVDVVDFDGDTAKREEIWTSCFDREFSYIHGGPVRASVRSRYRQWLTHKLAYWVEQFDRSGCVGCGRCIAWCPAAIDLTEEVSALRASPSRSEASMARTRSGPGSESGSSRGG